MLVCYAVVPTKLSRYWKKMSIFAITKYYTFLDHSVNKYRIIVSNKYFKIEINYDAFINNLSCLKTFDFIMERISHQWFFFFFRQLLSLSFPSPCNLIVIFIVIICFVKYVVICSVFEVNFFDTFINFYINS